MRVDRRLRYCPPPRSALLPAAVASVQPAPPLQLQLLPASGSALNMMQTALVAYCNVVACKPPLHTSTICSPEGTNQKR